MKKNHIALVAITGLYLTQLLSCVKVPPHFDVRDGNNVYSGCRIKEMAFYYYNRLSSYRTFTYNNNNDPVKVTSGPLQGMGFPDLNFKYDNKNRLIEYSGTFHVITMFDFEFLHRYGYSQNRIVTDTFYSLGNFDARGEPVVGHYLYYVYLKYDKLNRIVEDSAISQLPETQSYVTRYNYDQNGNLIISVPDSFKNGKGYDDKLNLHRTNKIWMFIDRNYSVNNPVTALGYNSSALPLSYPDAIGENLYDFDFAGIQWIDSTNIVYECR